MSEIHSSAIVHKDARLGRNVSIGPYCVVGPDVALGDGVAVMSHALVQGHSEIGSGTKIYPFAAIGCDPQNVNYRGEPTKLVIGSNTTVREHVTVHPGTVDGGGTTVVGDNCFLMVGAHVAHDCHVGDHVIMANNATLGGHVSVGDYTVLGGLTAIHQFVRIGGSAMVGGMSGVEHDVIPYGLVLGNRAELTGLNIVGLKRRGFDRNQIRDLRAAYRLLFADDGTMAQRLAGVAETFRDNELISEVIDFIKTESSRSIVVPRPSRAA